MYAGIISFTAFSCDTLLNKEFCLPLYYNIGSIVLGLLLSFKYIFSESSDKREILKISLNMAIFPLLISFCLLVFYNIASIF